jgi:hypothetical protein
MIERFGKLTTKELGYLINNEWDRLPAIFDYRTLSQDELGAFADAISRAVEKKWGKSNI